MDVTNTAAELNRVREQYRDISRQATDCFLAISQLAALNFMYQYSLGSFFVLFAKVLVPLRVCNFIVLVLQYRDESYIILCCIHFFRSVGWGTGGSWHQNFPFRIGDRQICIICTLQYICILPPPRLLTVSSELN